MRNAVLKLFSTNKALILLLALGSISWSLTMVKSGLLYDFGMGFWGPNGRDGIWHVAVAQSLARGTLEMPIYAGETIKNYHIGFDLLMAIIHKLTAIPVIHLYFQVLPPLFALLIGLLSYYFVLIWKKSKQAALWSLFFTYFGGSFGWILSYLRSGQIGGESIFWSQQQISTLVNPPLALSWILIFATLILLFKRKNFIVVGVIGSLILQAKAYGGVLFLGALLATSIYQIVFKKDWYYLKVFAVTFILSVVLFVPLNKSSTGLLVFEPFWFLETMMSYTDRVGWTQYFEAMINYRSGGNIVKGFLAYVVAFLIFWFGNLGLRGIKEVTLYGWIKRYRKLEVFEVLIAAIIVGGGMATLLFTQKGTAWNIIQFLYYSLLFSGILAGISVVEIIKKLQHKHLQIIVATFIVLLTIPTTIGTLWYSYLPGRAPSKISLGELDALQFLRNQPHGIVMRYPYDEERAVLETNPPIPLYLYARTAYVSAFSNKPTYLEDEINVSITGFDAAGRREKELQFLNTLSPQEARDFLRENNISYIYWVKPQRAKLGDTQLRLERIFENKEVDIWKVIE